MAERHWHEVEIIMMDFEGSPQTGVIEYGLVFIHSGNIVAVDSALCLTNREIPERDKRVHGIEDADLIGKKPFHTCYDAFVNHRRRGVFAAHNKVAENSFLKRTWSVPPNVPHWPDSSDFCRNWGPWIDTLALYRIVYPGLSSYGLGELTRVFQLEEKLKVHADKWCEETRRKSHCALYDALASALLLLRLGTENGFDQLSINWLIEKSRTNQDGIQQTL